MTADSKTSRPVLDEVEGYRALNVPNWDSYDGQPITPEIIDRAKAFIALLPPALPDPESGPGGDGSICFEWVWGSESKRTVYADIEPNDGGYHGFAKIAGAPGVEATFGSGPHLLAWLAPMFEPIPKLPEMTNG